MGLSGIKNFKCLNFDKIVHKFKSTHRILDIFKNIEW